MLLHNNHRKRRNTRTDTHTWSAVILLHPDVTVALGNTCLGVQEGETHGALGTQAGIVAAAVFNGFFIKLLTKAATERMGGGGRRRQGYSVGFSLTLTGWDAASLWLVIPEKC